MQIYNYTTPEFKHSLSRVQQQIVKTGRRSLFDYFQAVPSKSTITLHAEAIPTNTTI
jgi:hypothetical protein